MTEADRERLREAAEGLADLAIRLGFASQIELNIYEGGGSVNLTESTSFRNRLNRARREGYRGDRPAFYELARRLRRELSGR